VIAVGLPGAAGKMGRMIVKALSESKGARLAAALERPDSPSLGADAGLLAGIAPNGVFVGADIDAALAACDVMIDFTAPAATAEMARHAAERKVALVIGTTGLQPQERQAIMKAAERVPVVLSANMSLGVNVLFGLLDQAARALGDAYEVEIVELHHKQKRDAPSGTALSMARVLSQALGHDLPNQKVHAIRAGDIVGEHTAYFCGMGERLELTHRAGSRETFARGAVRAAEWVRGRLPALYDMRDVLGLR
jgi:4-hydroxy-tetrahydrodipicolinate reductase